jgi:hypothetical protein
MALGTPENTPRRLIVRQLQGRRFVAGWHVVCEHDMTTRDSLELSDSTTVYARTWFMQRVQVSRQVFSDGRSIHAPTNPMDFVRRLITDIWI